LHRFHRVRPERVFLTIAAVAAFVSTLAFTITPFYRFQVAGLDDRELVLAGTVMEADVFLFEIPTGIVADHRPALTKLFLKASRRGSAAALLAVPMAFVLAGGSLHVPIIVAGATSIALGLWLIAAMSERRFTRTEHRSTWAAMASTGRQGMRAIRASHVLIALAVAIFLAGGASEAYDRYVDKYLLVDLGPPVWPGWSPLTWMAVVACASALLGIHVPWWFERRRGDLDNDQQRRWIVGLYGGSGLRHLRRAGRQRRRARTVGRGRGSDSPAWHSAAMSVARRAVVLFVPEPVAGLVDDVRRRWDPVMLGRIDAHVTLVHDLVDAAGKDPDSAQRLVEEAAAATAPFEITLTTAHCWSRATNGVYLDVDDPTGGIETLHAQLAALESPAWARAGFRPHVTLVHGRTVAPDLAEPAWAALCDVTFGWTVQLSALDVIELDEATGWRSLLRLPLGRRHTVTSWQAPTITSASARRTFPQAPASSS